MESSSLIIGAFALAFGVFTLVMRFTYPEKLAKIKMMKEKLGNTAGNVVHAVFYIVLPNLFGILCLILGYRGISIMG